MNTKIDQDNGYHPMSPSHKEREVNPGEYEREEKEDNEPVWDPDKDALVVPIKHPHV